MRISPVVSDGDELTTFGVQKFVRSVLYVIREIYVEEIICGEQLEKNCIKGEIILTVIKSYYIIQAITYLHTVQPEENLMIWMYEPNGFQWFVSNPEQLDHPVRILCMPPNYYHFPLNPVYEYKTVTHLH